MIPQVQPGEVTSMLTSEPPERGESWESIRGDFDKIIAPGCVRLRVSRVTKADELSTGSHTGNILR